MKMKIITETDKLIYFEPDGNGDVEFEVKHKSVNSYSSY